MITEKTFEDIIVRYPEIIEDGLTFKGRQVTVFGRRMDILFEDKFHRKLILELKAGPILDQHIGQVLSYEGMILSADDPSIRVMLVGNRVPPNVKRSLDHHGIAWKEISNNELKIFLQDKKDEEFINLFNDENPIATKLPNNLTPPANVLFTKKTKEPVKSFAEKPTTVGGLYSVKAGIKIFKGGKGPTANNINVSLKNNINFENIGHIKNLSLRQHLTKLKETNTPTYAWAALKQIQKDAYPGMIIFFVVTDKSELYSFEYINSFFDPQCEFRKYIHWTGFEQRGAYKDIVFLKNMKETKLTDNKLLQILNLFGAVYNDSANRFQYTPIISADNIKHLGNILSTN